MGCKLTLSLISESQEGTVGDDWKYSLEAKVYSGALTGEATVSVAKHKLASGQTTEPHGNPDALVIPAGEAGADVTVKLRLTATEVDLFKDDTGEHSVTLHLQNPEAGKEPISEEHAISVGVTESPGQLKTSIFTLNIGLHLANE